MTGRWRKPTRPWWLPFAAFWLALLGTALATHGGLEVVLSVGWALVGIRRTWGSPTPAPGWWPERWQARAE